ncbi:hypothetical protein [Hyalangium minutum]|uniref:Uncharacterized protein n=1 Tax=Hyalangium minutum TaxID=394096 RepID=A0A085WU48_9BACT|nr:hypothetical protein [Hyalangium minutum]KFE71211.1 hypothetical protein DB31_3341 [Hyalangium minutum]
MADIDQVVLFQDRQGWSVKVLLRKGGSRRYRYASEAQARYFAAVFELGPRQLPPTAQVSRRMRRSASSGALPVDRIG